MNHRGRKYISSAEQFKHDGCYYQVNSKVSGVYTEILHSLIDQLNACLDRWGRVFVMRFDLHQGHQTNGSELVSRFIKNLKRRIVRAYSVLELGYLWVREQERAKKQHYHVAVFVDGDKVRHSAALSSLVFDVWERLRTSLEGHSVYIPKRCFYNVGSGDGEQMGVVVFRLSYLAKARGKGYRDKQAKDYGASRLSATTTTNQGKG